MNRIFLLLLLCPAVSHQHTYTHLCDIPPLARATFRFPDERACVRQQQALSAEVLPDVLVDEPTAGTCTYSNASGWTAVGAWIPSPRGLDVTRWRLEESAPPRRLVFTRRGAACANCTVSDSTCIRAWPAVCGSVILLAYVAWLAALLTR